MIRKLIVVCFAAIAAMAMAATSASAQHGVFVEFPDTYEAESTVDIRVSSHSPLGVETTLLSCDNHWDVTINENGEGFIDAEGIFPFPGDVGNCETAEPCTSHAVWPLELEEEPAETDPPHPARFKAHVTFCLENTGNAIINDKTASVECDYDAVNNEGHCDEPTTFGTSLFEVMGEVDVHGDPGVMHAAQ